MRARTKILLHFAAFTIFSNRRMIFYRMFVRIHQRLGGTLSRLDLESDPLELEDNPDENILCT